MKTASLVLVLSLIVSVSHWPLSATSVAEARPSPTIQGRIMAAVVAVSGKVEVAAWAMGLDYDEFWRELPKRPAGAYTVVFRTPHGAPVMLQVVNP